MLAPEFSFRGFGRLQSTKKERASVLGIVLFEEHALALIVWESLLFHDEVKLHLSLEDFTLQAGSVEVLIHWNITRVHSLADFCAGSLRPLNALGCFLLSGPWGGFLMDTL